MLAAIVATVFAAQVGTTSHVAKLRNPIQFMLQGTNAGAIASWQQSWRLDRTFPYVSYDVTTPLAWDTIHTQSFASFATLETEIGTPAMGANVNVLLYDNEKWPQTPIDEQMAPATYEKQFCELAHTYDYACMTAPAPDLVVVQPGQTQYGEYLAQGFPQFSAANSDFYAIQSQGYQNNLSLYESFVKQAALQALSVHPKHKLWVLAGLSTNPNPQQGEPTLSILTTDIADTRDSVAGGYWLNIPTPGENCPKCGPANVPLAEGVIRAENFIEP